MGRAQWLFGGVSPSVRQLSKLTGIEGAWPHRAIEFIYRRDECLWVEAQR